MKILFLCFVTAKDGAAAGQDSKPTGLVQPTLIGKVLGNGKVETDRGRDVDGVRGVDRGT